MIDDQRSTINDQRTNDRWNFRCFVVVLATFVGTTTNAQSIVDPTNDQRPTLNGGRKIDRWVVGWLVIGWLVVVVVVGRLPKH